MNNSEIGWLKEALERIEAKQDEHSIHIATIVERVSGYSKDIDDIKKELDPVKKHVDFVSSASKVGATAVGIAAALHSLGVL